MTDPTELDTILLKLEGALKADGWPRNMVQALRMLERAQRQSDGQGRPALNLHLPQPLDCALADAIDKLTATLALGFTRDAGDSPVAQSPVVEQPSRWGRVHMMGHQEHVGEIQQLPGGALLVHGINRSLERGVYRYHFTAERHGRHSVEWLTECEWEAHCAEVYEVYEKAVEHERRRNQLPEKYREFEREVRDPTTPGGRYGFMTPDGKVWGWWHVPAYARAAAWRHADGDLAEIDGSERPPTAEAAATCPDRERALVEADPPHAAPDDSDIPF